MQQVSSLEIRQRQVKDVVILDCKGRITLGGGAGNLRETIRELAAKGKEKVVLNLAETVFVDSMGIAELVSSFNALSNQGAQLKLCTLTKKVRDLLQITKLYAVFEVFETENAAVQSFAS